MEREIKKRAGLYAVVAVISAIVLGAFVYNFPIYPPEPGQPTQPSQLLLSTFSSYGELRNFLLANSKTQGFFPFYSPSDVNTLTTLTRMSLDIVNSAESLKIDYSTTNIQVAGVDEADIVKTDGEHIYQVSGNNVTILKTYPPEEAQVLSKITFTEAYPAGIFVSDNRLVVLASSYSVSTRQYYEPFVIDIKTSAKVYDISDKTQPQLLGNFTLSGSYFYSRMIGDYVYFVVSQPAYVVYDTVVLPKVYTDDGIKEILPSDIYHANATDNYYLFTTVAAWNIRNPEQEPTYKTLMLGGTSSMYVSLDNVYITFPEPDDKTSIYRIRIEEEALTIEAHGKVPGRELSQFSMDEYENCFRIATETRTNGTVQSNVYIFDMNLSIVGQLEDIAPNETLDSARFIGNRAYLSTSVVQRDPFFVIDVENASNPTILGYLKIPGFTRYLHPYDGDHLIGIGRDGLNVKISLFDVTKVSAPIELAKYYFEDFWSDTPVLTEHKAFLFDKEKELLVFPMLRSNLDYSPWQGACVFRISRTGGLVYRGGVSHQDPGVNSGDTKYYVSRELYIESVLYTVSYSKVQMNKLSDLSLIGQIQLP